MVQRNPSESSEHEGLIRMMARHFQNQGFTDIRADLAGFVQPDVITGGGQSHRPDLTCRRNGVGGAQVILEAETASTIFDDHTASQWTLFSRAARQRGGEFHVAVPKLINGRSGRDVAKDRARQLGITLDQVWTPS